MEVVKKEQEPMCVKVTRILITGVLKLPLIFITGIVFGALLVAFTYVPLWFYFFLKSWFILIKTIRVYCCGCCGSIDDEIDKSDMPWIHREHNIENL